MEAIERLRAAKARADESANDISEMDRYIADRLSHGGWSANDAAEYRDAASAVLRSGSDDEIRAAREFWSDALATGAAVGINQRIRMGVRNAE